MKQKSKLFFFLFGIVATLSSQNIEETYINMPDDVDSFLSKKQRIELLEYHKAALGDSVKNSFGTQSRVLVFDTTYNTIVVKNTEISTLEMKIFTVGKKTIVGVIKTVCAPICSSSINFYDEKWGKTRLGFFPPTAWDWVDSNKLPKDRAEQEELRRAVSTSFISYSFTPKKNQIISKNNSLDFLGFKEKEKVKDFFKQDDLVFELVKNKFVRH